jgi:predicted metal-dependent enzyme (double-stranded beta helix superfamily)
MKKLALMAMAAILMFAFTTEAVMAQEKAKAEKAEKGKAVLKVLAENDKVRVQEVAFKPGDENTSVPSSSTRVVRALKGGTLMRTYADGKTQKVEWKTGEARINEPDKVAYTVKNVGKTDVMLYVVVLK